jgi:hypothetical protein
MASSGAQFPLVETATGAKSDALELRVTPKAVKFIIQLLHSLRGSGKFGPTRDNRRHLIVT